LAAATIMVVLAGVTIMTTKEPSYGASPTTVTLVVHKGGDRTAPQAVSGLAGATFEFIAGVAGTPPTAASPVAASCVTDATGNCSVDLPGRDVGDQGYWIREASAPAGWRLLTSLDTGPGSATVPTTYNLLFTGPVSNNTTRTFPEAQTGNSIFTARGDTWANARVNPVLADTCGLTVALLLDTSASIAPFLTDLKNAANAFVDALTGTPSQLALYRFASDATQLTGVIPTPDAATTGPLHTAINGLTAAGATNWDAGLFQIAASPTTFDVVLMLTDGNPTVYGPNAEGPTANTRFREVENGIFSANALKALGTKVAAVGVGAGVTGATENLQAISGPIEGVDYVQTNFAQLGTLLRNLALARCLGTVNIIKRVIPFNGTVANSQLAGGWTFTSPTPGVIPTSGTTDAATGAVSFEAPLGGQPSLPVTFTETVQPGFTLEPQAGQNATCLLTGSPTPSTNVGTDGFTVTATATGVVSCTVYNRAPAPIATVQVLKTWNINGTVFSPGVSPPAEFQASLQLTGQVNPQFGAVFGPYAVGASVTVGETTNLALLPPGCTSTTGGDLGAHTLVEGLNVFNLLNTVVCETRLTLFKEVVNPFGTPEPVDSWTLTTFVPGTSTPLFSGTNGVNGVVLPVTRYLLGESTVPGYAQEIAPNAVIVPPSTGTWHCSLRLRDGTLGPEYDGLNGGVTVQLGQFAECTAINNALPAHLTLDKVVTGEGTLASPRDWLLSAVPPAPETPLVGRNGDATITVAEATPGVAYALSEAEGAAGYTPVGTEPVCVLTGTTTALTLVDGALTPDVGQDITCTFTNAGPPPPPPPPPTLAVTGGRPVAPLTTGLVFLTVGVILVGATVRPKHRPRHRRAD
jgi:hypothetical protein